MILTIIITSVITSLVVSYAWSKWFMHNLTKWMEEFFKTEQKFIKMHFDEFVEEIKKERGE